MNRSAILEPWQPTARDPFDLAKVGHLLRRAGFGAALPLRRRLQKQGVDAAVAHVLDGSRAGDPDLLQPVIALGDIARVRAWRVWRMLRCRRPLAERLSFFWHGHFATSNQKLRDPRAMALQQDLFDRLGTGPFPELLLAVSRDPAMIRWLDNDTNVAGQPNENFARELFELFALGRGNYTERDIREAARAFTGWHVRDGRFHFVPRFHDRGIKEVFGQRGAFGGEDIVRLTAERPESARFLARKWLQFFVHPEPEDDEVEALAACYLEQGRHVGRTLAVLLRSRLFFGDRAYRSRIKSPVDFAVGMVRDLGGRASPQRLARAIGAMGQVLLEPPSVEGWQGERNWLNSATWIRRSNFAAELLAGRRYGLRPRAADLLDSLTEPQARAKAAVLYLLDGRLRDESMQQVVAFAASEAGRGPGGAGSLLHAVATLPEAQLL